MNICEKCVVDEKSPRVALDSLSYDGEIVRFKTQCPNCGNVRVVRVPMIFIEIAHSKFGEKPK